MKRLIFNNLHRYLLKFIRLKKNFATNRIIYLLSKLLLNYNGIIETVIHGSKVKVNNGFTYQKTVRTYPNYNDPLYDIVGEISAHRNKKINIVDVGAAIGDTALLLLSNLYDNINKIHCIDGDRDFFKLLENNLKKEEKAAVYFCLLSSTDNNLIPELVRIHNGTASAQGNSSSNSMTLDSLIDSKKIDSIDLIKIDVDGFDGQVMNGAMKTLSQYKCPIIFELHPKLIKDTNNRIQDIFDALQVCNYTKCYWFSKFGIFNHFTETVNPSLEFYEELCLRNNFEEDWHYDIIALHEYESLNIFNVIERKYSSTKKSFF